MYICLCRFQLRLCMRNEMHHAIQSFSLSWLAWYFPFSGFHLVNGASHIVISFIYSLWHGSYFYQRMKNTILWKWELIDSLFMFTTEVKAAVRPENFAHASKRERKSWLYEMMWSDERRCCDLLPFTSVHFSLIVVSNRFCHFYRRSNENNSDHFALIQSWYWIKELYEVETCLYVSKSVERGYW